MVDRQERFTEGGIGSREMDGIGSRYGRMSTIWECKVLVTEATVCYRAQSVAIIYFIADIRLILREFILSVDVLAEIHLGTGRKLLE